MKNKHLAMFLVLAALLLLAAGAVVMAQSSANFDLSWNVIGNGGGDSSSARYVVSGTVGQSGVSQTAVDSANFELNSGFWTATSTTQLYIPLVIKN